MAYYGGDPNRYNSFAPNSNRQIIAPTANQSRPSQQIALNEIEEIQRTQGPAVETLTPIQRMRERIRQRRLELQQDIVDTVENDLLEARLAGRAPRDNGLADDPLVRDLLSRNRSGQATLNEVDTLIENASRLRLEAAYEPAQIEERFAPPQLTMRRGLVHSQYAPSIASSQNVAGGQQPLPAYNPYSSGFHAPLSGHMPLGGSYAPSQDFGPPSSAGGIEINRAISPMENSPAGSLHSPPTPMPRAQVKQWPAQAPRAQPDSLGTQKLHSILHFHASQSHSNVLQGHPDSVSTPEQRLAYSKNVMPNSMQHKRMIQDLVDKLLEDPPAPDTKYYIVYQMPRPSTTQKYPNKGGKVTSAKVGQLPDMWLCLSAFSAFGFSDGCHEKANCVYREGWFSVQEEVIIAYHAPKWLDEARIAWQANKVNGQITHHTKVWPYAPEPCQYDDRFGATISSQPQEKSGANKETSGENKVNTGQKGLLGPHSNPTPLSKPNPLSTGGPATEDAAQTLLRKLRRE